MAPTTYMIWCALPGSASTNRGARYLSQFTRTWAYLSIPNRIGATVNPTRSRVNACHAGSCSSVRLTAELRAAVIVAMSPPLKVGFPDHREGNLLCQDSSALE